MHMHSRLLWRRWLLSCMSSMHRVQTGLAPSSLVYGLMPLPRSADVVLRLLNITFVQAGDYMQYKGIAADEAKHITLVCKNKKEKEQY